MFEDIIGKDVYKDKIKSAERMHEKVNELEEDGDIKQLAEIARWYIEDWVEGVLDKKNEKMES
jgi:hypothetical protein